MNRLNTNGYTAMVFGLFWLLLFCIYLPAAKAGFVTDFTGWLDQVKNHSFSEFINRSNFQAKSFYQFTQFNTWVCYKLLGTNKWLWHLLFITLHATNALLVYTFFRQLFADAAVSAGGNIALGGSLLFCVSPYISEVIIWEPSFHFLQGLLLIMIVLHATRRFIKTGNATFAGLAIFTYLLSLFSLEIFYITPALVLTLALFYRSGSDQINDRFKKVIVLICLPMIGLFLLRFLAYRWLSGEWVSRIGTDSVTAVQLSWFGKPAKYLFHLLALGRFMSNEWREKSYSICGSLPGIIAFYVVVVGILALIARRFHSFAGKARVASLLFVWLLAALLLLVPLWFPSNMLVLYDRYTYFAGPFFYMLFALVASLVTLSYLHLGIMVLFALVNLRFAIQVSRYWSKSSRIVNSLVNNIPDDRSKTIILLNIPQCMHGVAMIGAEKNSEYKLMHDLLVPDKPLTNTVYDVLAYNMLTPDDGAHINVINDSLIKVTLNQWGTWWWFETRGAYSYWTSDYKLDLKDPGHWYELTLRKPADNYLIIYNVGDQWKVVDWSKKNVDQN